MPYFCTPIHLPRPKILWYPDCPEQFFLHFLGGWQFKGELLNLLLDEVGFENFVGGRSFFGLQFKH